MSKPIEVRGVDPSDDDELRRYHSTFARGSEAGRTDPTTWTLAEVTVNLREPGPSRRVEVYIAYDGDTPVGAGDVMFPQLDNTNFAQFEFAVSPEYRRRGAGAAMFQHVLDRAKAQQRSTLSTEVTLPPGETSVPAVKFLSERGLTSRNTEIRRQLKLPVDGTKLDELAAKAAERIGDYRILTWSGHCPDEHAEQYANLKGLLVSEAPTGESTYEAEKWDVDRLRAEERKGDRQGRTLYTAVAIAPDGTLAGHTQAVFSVHEDRRAYQWDTLVLDEHRGHRLGLALKVENMRALQAAHPELNRIETWNAEQNGPMVKVNVDLGFQIIEYCQEWEGEL